MTEVFAFRYCENSGTAVWEPADQVTDVQNYHNRPNCKRDQRLDRNLVEQRLSGPQLPVRTFFTALLAYQWFERMRRVSTRKVPKCIYFDLTSLIVCGSLSRLWLVRVLIGFPPNHDYELSCYDVRYEERCHALGFYFFATFILRRTGRSRSARMEGTPAFECFTVHWG
jgi:hypothetical protein